MRLEKHEGESLVMSVKKVRFSKDPGRLRPGPACDQGGHRSHGAEPPACLPPHQPVACSRQVRTCLWGQLGGGV